MAPLIELLDAIGPDPEAEPSLGAPNGTNQAQSWGYDAGTLDDREDEHDGREPGENEPILPRLRTDERQSCWPALRHRKPCTVC